MQNLGIRSAYNYKKLIAKQHINFEIYILIFEFEC